MFETDGKTGEAKLDDAGVPLPRTSHSLNRVPFYVFAPGAGLELDAMVEAPGLANLAATVLQLMGYRAPDDFAASLLKS
jgi:2,3-bisphosphoglycerate-independent phosphoglycerate mutase